MYMVSHTTYFVWKDILKIIGLNKKILFVFNKNKNKVFFCVFQWTIAAFFFFFSKKIRTVIIYKEQMFEHP